MAASSETLVCPKGHLSTEADYCSECGAKLQGAVDQPFASGCGTGQICPDCGALREQKDIAFCEVCGYNFVSGAHGEVGIMPTTDPPEPIVEPGPPQGLESHETQSTPTLRWLVTVTIDPALRSPDSPSPPTDVAPVTVALQEPVSLIGRLDEARGIFPEIALPMDEAVSRRHALLEKDGASGMLLRDIGAVNGTKLNGIELKPMQDYPVKNGDEITLGHWSRIQLHGA